MKKLLQSLLFRFGYSIHKVGSGFWDQDDVFLSLYKKCIRTDLEKKAHRMYMLYQCAQAARVLHGDVAELGVYKGDSAKMLSEVFKGTKKILLFDTFSGLPGERSAISDNNFDDTSVGSVKEYLKEYSNVHLFPGFFPETAKNITGEYCLVYLDADLSKSIQDGLEFFYPKMVPGGFIVIDDYHSKYWPRVTAVVDEFLNKIGNPLLISAPNQCIIIAR